MKSAIVCYVCKKAKKFSETYAVKITDYSVMPQLTDIQKVVYTFPQLKVRVCRFDIKKMGYKAKTVKPKVKLEKKQ